MVTTKTKTVTKTKTKSKKRTPAASIGGDVGLLHVHVVLDRSGSMGSCHSSTISALNEYLGSLRETNARVSVHLFDSQWSGLDLLTVRSDIPSSEVRHITHAEYQPRGSTPLYDAIGTVVNRIQTSDRVALVIVTDGYENASKEFNRDGVASLIRDRQERGWMVIYLGANQDAWAVGSQLGMSAANTMSYSTQNMGGTFGAAARSTASYASGQSAALSGFTEDEREEVMKPGR